MKRREFITLLGGAAVAWPLDAKTQQSGIPVIGHLNSAFVDTWHRRLVAFQDGLKETGYIDGTNVRIEYRWAEGQYDRLPALAADLVRKEVSVIAATGGGVTARAAKAATNSIPIVFANGTDPVENNLVASLNRPGGNVTGVTFLVDSLAPKLFEVLHETVPKAAVIGVLINPANPEHNHMQDEVLKAAASLGLAIHVLNASSERDFDVAFADFARQHGEALIVAADTLFGQLRQRIVALAARYALPTFYPYRDFVDVGGLVSYGTSVNDANRQAGIYVGRILKGEKPADLPVQQSVRVELVINLKTAKALGITFPITLLGRADEVIE
jgi:putative ABC transport system substrate-binding protein